FVFQDPEHILFLLKAGDRTHPIASYNRLCTAMSTGNGQDIIFGAGGSLSGMSAGAKRLRLSCSLRLP
ncbi:MAG: hypothetical protein NTV99_08590, partial [Deltaproteobacteria bacterium]|nr:hypothetical protein [Deltaproteobacteria bacterium]